MTVEINTRPTLWVRARVTPEVTAEFESWYISTHLPHVLNVPGIVRAQRVRGSSDQDGSHLMVFEFADSAAVQPALSSEEAQQARKDWDHWRPHLQELSIEIYAPLSPIEAYHHRN